MSSSSFCSPVSTSALLNGGVVSMLRVTAVAASMIACSQTLSILLTHQLCADTEPDGPSCAIDLENSVVVLAPLVPWSIAGAVPLASAGAPEQSLLAACYLYLIPLCSLVRKLLRRRRVTA